MRDVNTKADNVDSMPAANYNAQRAELENAVLSTDQTLDPDAGPDTDLNMLGKAMGAYANAGNVYQDSGVADTYVLSLTTNLKTVTKYYDNMMIVFKAGATNTGASTVNINALGVKSITLSDGTALSADDILLDSYVMAIYSLSNNRFELTKAVAATSDFPQIRDKSRNLVISNPSASTIDVDADEVSLQNTDTPPSSFIAQGVNLTIDIAASGANGLDTGSEASDTWYYIWAIFNGSTVAGLLSTSATAPTMPSGYTYKALMGAVRNDNSNDFIDFTQEDDLYLYNANRLTQSGLTGSAWTALTANEADFFPSIAKEALIMMAGQGNIQAASHRSDGNGGSYSHAAASGVSGTIGGLVINSDRVSTFRIKYTGSIYYFTDISTASEMHTIGFYL